MARYVALVGKRVEVHYRAGDIYLPAVGTLVADSGKSIFLEEYMHHNGNMKSFRWEIPYPFIVKIAESEPPPPASPVPGDSAKARTERPVVRALGLKSSAFEL